MWEGGLSNRVVWGAAAERKLTQKLFLNTQVENNFIYSLLLGPLIDQYDTR